MKQVHVIKRFQEENQNISSTNGVSVTHWYYQIFFQGFRVTCLFTGQYNTKGYDTIKDILNTFEYQKLDRHLQAGLPA